MKPGFPYPYYFYGSHDSQDADVLIQIPASLMPPSQEERKQLMKSIELEWELSWNANLIVIEDGRISNTIFTKSWIDSLTIHNVFITPGKTSLSTSCYRIGKAEQAAGNIQDLAHHAYYADPHRIPHYYKANPQRHSSFSTKD
jgi:hypothetical protein